MLRPILMTTVLTLAACEPNGLFNMRSDKINVSDKTGAEIFAENCASCHGADAKGGAMEGPPDLTTLTKRHGGTFPARYVMSTIDGYAQGATRGPMPEFGAHLESQMEVWVDENGVMTPPPAALVRLAEYLESVQG